MKKITLDVSKKVNGAYSKVGEMTVTVPTLADAMAFVGSPIKKDEKGADMEDEGIPIYESTEANWIQGAIMAAVKAQARNKLVPGTADVKPGLKIAENWEEICAEGVRDGAGLALAREAKQAFSDWVAKQGLSEKAAATLNVLFSNKAALQLQAAGTKEKMKARVEAFAASLDEATLEKLMRPVQAVMDACEAATEDALEGI